MKTLNASKIRNTVEALTSKAILVIRTLLCIRFVTPKMSASFHIYFIKMLNLFNCAHARKRLLTRVVHHRKFALFTPGNEQGSFK